MKNNEYNYYKDFGVFGVEAKVLLLEVGHRVMEEFEDPRSNNYLLQRISVAVQQGNAAVVLGTSRVLNVLDVEEGEGFVLLFVLL